MLHSEITGEKYIDLNNIPSNFYLPIQSIIDTGPSNIDKEVFTFEETVVNDASASIKYCQYGSKMLIEIFGPREVKYREKMKMDSAIVETYIKMNYESSKENKESNTAF
jgi:hypothetical protein